MGALGAAAREKTSALLKTNCKSNGRAYLTFGLDLFFRAAKEVVKVQYGFFFKKRRRRWRRRFFFGFWQRPHVHRNLHVWLYCSIPGRRNDNAGIRSHQVIMTTMNVGPDLFDVFESLPNKLLHALDTFVSKNLDNSKRKRTVHLVHR